MYILNMYIDTLINMIISYNEYAQVKMPPYPFHGMSKWVGFAGIEVFLLLQGKEFPNSVNVEHFGKP